MGCGEQIFDCCKSICVPGFPQGSGDFIFPGIWFFLSFPDCEAINFQHAQSFAKGPSKALETCWSFPHVPSISGCSQDIEGP